MLRSVAAVSDAQIEETDAYFERREQEGSLDPDNFCDEDMHQFLADKMVALDRDMAEFCYLLCRSLRATRVVEAGTSFGVSTLYLAAAVRDNQVDNGVVIGTEHEPTKAAIARQNFQAAELSEFIDLREGDLRETLKDVGGPVDFMLVDIWDVNSSPRASAGARWLYVTTQRWTRLNTATILNLCTTAPIGFARSRCRLRVGLN